MGKITDKISKILETINMKQFFKFIFVGFINITVFYGTYYVMLQLGFFYAIALTVGTAVGILNSYIWNKFFTFKSKKVSASEPAKFLIVHAIQYLSNLLIIHMCISFVGISPELAGLVAITIGTFISYLGHKFWSFR